MISSRRRRRHLEDVQTQDIGTGQYAERICGSDLNGDNLRIYRAYLRINDHCRVTVRVRVKVSVRVGVGVGVADCCIQTAGESDKTRINHVIKTDQWRSAPQIRPAPHFVVSRHITVSPAGARSGTLAPCGLRVERTDSLSFPVAGCHNRQLNQALSVLSNVIERELQASDLTINSKNIVVYVLVYIIYI